MQVPPPAQPRALSMMASADFAQPYISSLPLCVPSPTFCSAAGTQDDVRKYKLFNNSTTTSSLLRRNPYFLLSTEDAIVPGPSPRSSSLSPDSPGFSSESPCRTTLPAAVVSPSVPHTRAPVSLPRFAPKPRQRARLVLSRFSPTSHTRLSSASHSVQHLLRKVGHLRLRRAALLQHRFHALGAVTIGPVASQTGALSPPYLQRLHIVHGLLNDTHSVRVLFDHGATHSYIRTSLATSAGLMQPSTTIL